VLSGEAALSGGFEVDTDSDPELKTSVDAVPRVHPAAAPAPASGPGETPTPSYSTGDLASQLREIERQRVIDALTRTGWNQSKAARMLGITRAVLIHRIKMFGLSRPSELEDGGESPSRSTKIE
jgi:transcriptional regulator with GAF, ATPase, and Fis domain